MKKFNFELQKVLDFRDFERQQAESELSKALAAENEINKNLETIASQYIAIKNQMKDSVDFSAIMSQSRYYKLLDYQKEELLKQLAQAKLVTEEKRTILQECMKKTTALEKMKEAQLQAYKEAVEHEEAEEMDELATIRRV